MYLILCHLIDRICWKKILEKWRVPGLLPGYSSTLLDTRVSRFSDTRQLLDTRVLEKVE